MPVLAVALRYVAEVGLYARFPVHVQLSDQVLLRHGRSSRKHRPLVGRSVSPGVGGNGENALARLGKLRWRNRLKCDGEIGCFYSSANNPRFETPPGRQLQFDWKEGMRLVDSEGEVFEFSVFTATLGYSRKHRFIPVRSRTLDDLLSCLLATFTRLGGVPEECITDNMSCLVTVSGRRRTRQERAWRFAREAGFELRLCAPRSPQTKGKDESANRFLNRLLAYGGEFTGWSGLAEAVARVEAQANSEPNRTTGLPPDALFMREKESLRPIGNLRLLESMVGDVSVQTVPPTMLVRAAGREWSVPRRCIGRRVSVIAMPGGQVVVRMAGEEVAVHDAASGPSRPINYDPDHYGQALEGKRGLADADIAEAARANLALLDSLGGA
nr:DDE-type integrase/transposase/recombinase [Collinsella aerofaciens]